VDNEDCDRGPGNSSTCDSDCTIPICGDGHFNPAFSEDCDEGGDHVDCDGDCSEVECGDGYFNPEAEECDDGNDDDGDGCESDCTLP
jgi:cysteine-rich repeat protein